MTSKSNSNPNPNKKEANMDQSLSLSIPPSFYLDDYVGREVAGIPDLDVLAAAHAARHNVLLYGPTGSAKTSLVYAYAVKAGLPVVNVACNGGIDIRQLIGGWTPQPDGSFDFIPGDLVLGVQQGAVILFNEINFLPPKLAAFVFALLDRRRQIFIPDAAGSSTPTMIQASPSTFILADFNPGYEGTRPLNKALRNRFAISLEWGYNHDVEDQLLSSAALLEMAEALRKRVDAGDLDTPIPTNALIEFEQFAWDEALGYDFAVLNFVNRFDDHEKVVIREVLEQYSDRIKTDLFDES